MVYTYYKERKHMLTFLYGMLAGYLVCSFYVAKILVTKGYTSMYQIPDREESQ